MGSGSFVGPDPVHPSARKGRLMALLRLTTGLSGPNYNVPAGALVVLSDREEQSFLEAGIAVPFEGDAPGEPTPLEAASASGPVEHAADVETAGERSDVEPES